MFHPRVVIVGAGQAGLAVSKQLTDADVDHVLLERGRTAEHWSSQRWDSLRLLTPNWMSRLPGWSYRGSDPAGYMPAVEVAEFLAGYAASFGAPVVHGAEVRSVRRHRGRYQVISDAGSWSARCGCHRHRLLRSAVGARDRQGAAPVGATDHARPIPEPGGRPGRQSARRRSLLDRGPTCR